MKLKKTGALQSLFLAVAMIFTGTLAAQSAAPQKTRLAKLEIYPEHLTEYKAALEEQARTAVKQEPGVLTLYAVFEKEKPTHLTILEIYASEEAYQHHIKTAHFLKYKNGTLNMVKSLELIEVDPLIPGLKIK
jgi:quinol monooxygenase YgiN